MNNQSSIRSGILMSYGIIIFNIFAGLIYTPWMISQIGKEEYGLYILVTTFLSYFTVDYGLWQAINKLIAEQHVKNNIQKQNEIINVANTLYVILDIFILLILVFVYFNLHWIFNNLPSNQFNTLQVLFSVAAIFAVLSFPFLFLKGIYMGKELFVQTKIFDIVKKVATITITLLLLYLNMGVTSLVIAFGLVPFITYIVETIYLRKFGIIFGIGKFDRKIAKSIFSLSVWLFIIVLGEMFLNNFAPTLLGVFSNSTEIAIFAIGLSLYSYVYTFAGAINGFFLPKVFKLKNNENNCELLKKSREISSIQLWVVGFFILGILCLGQDFIDLWVGSDFGDSYYVACFLLIPALITFCQPIESTELFASNKIRYKSIMMLFTAFLSVGLSIFFSTRYGARGVAFSIGFSSFLFLGVGMNIIYKFVLKRKIVVFAKLMTKFLLTFVAIYLLFRILEAHWNINNWIDLIIKGILFTVFYILLTYVFSVPAEIKKIYIYPICHNFLRKF